MKTSTTEQPAAKGVGVGTVTRRWLLAIVVTALPLAGGCEEAIPPVGPDPPPAEGIIIYPEVNYSGTRSQITSDVPDLQKRQGPCGKDWTRDWDGIGGYYSRYDWSYCVSSIKVAPGWRATIYSFANYLAWSQELTADVPDLGQVDGPCGIPGTWNDCIVSIRVAPK